MAIIFKFRSRRTPQPAGVLEPEPCACCLGRAGDIPVYDRSFCTTWDAFIRAGQIVPAADGCGYESTTKAAALHLEAGLRLFDERHIS